jgi:hypothetical protein
MSPANPPQINSSQFDEDWIRSEYFACFGKELDLINPLLFTEKMQAYKLEYKNPNLTKLADKYAVRDYVAATIGKSYLIPLIGCFDSLDEIPFEKLPNKFVIKATHGCSWNLICKNKQNFDWNSEKGKLEKWLKTNYFLFHREWAYKYIMPRIIIEEFIQDNAGRIPADFKVFCFNGDPKMIQVDYDRFTNHTRAVYDQNWNKLQINFIYPDHGSITLPPKNLDLMLENARTLSKEFPFVRVDFYSLQSKLYFGEMTFYPTAGLVKFNPSEWDRTMGDWFDISGFRELTNNQQQINYKKNRTRSTNLSNFWKRFMVIANHVSPIFHRLRLLIIPPFSRRARLARRIWNSLFLFDNIREFINQKREIALIKQSGYFDKNWYLTHYPDIIQPKVDPLIHYLKIGGFEGRDPGPNFHSGWYLHKYSSRSKNELNPLIYFIEKGKEDGHLPLPDWSLVPLGTDEKRIEQVKSNVIPSKSHPGRKLKFGLVTIIRNEQDILNTFLNHIDALFDYVVLLDHRSVDGSAEILRTSAKHRKNWTVVALDINGWYQKEASNLVMQYLFEKNADVVFFLDCDEFVQVENRSELEKKVSRLMDPPVVGSFRWVNCICERLNDLQFGYESSIISILEPSHQSKVIIPRSLYQEQKGNLFLSAGNHQVLDGIGNPFRSEEIGNIIHIPVRSRNQLIRKAVRSSIANIARSNRNPAEGFQFFEVLKMLAAGEIDEDVVRGCIYLYQIESKIIPLKMIDLMKGKYSKISLKNLKIASSQKFSSESLYQDDKFIERLIANQILFWENENPGNLIFDKKQKIIYFRP